MSERLARPLSAVALLLVALLAACTGHPKPKPTPSGSGPVERYDPPRPDASPVKSVG